MEIGAQAILIQPLVHFPSAHQIRDDAQGVAPAAQLLHCICAALYHRAAALGLPVLVAKIRGIAPDQLRVAVIGQPAPPQHLVRGLAHIFQGPFPVYIVPLVDHILEPLGRIFRLHAAQLCDFRPGGSQISRVLVNDPEGTAQIQKNITDVRIHGLLPPFHRAAGPERIRAECSGSPGNLQSHSPGGFPP